MLTDDADRPVLTAWDVLKPSTDKISGLNHLLRGVGLLALSQLRDNVTIATLIESHAITRPHHPALVFEDRQWTYAQFNATANRYARTLMDGGIGQGDVVGVLLDNRPHTLLLVAALAKLGAIAGMCNTRQRGTVLTHGLATLAPRAMLVGSELVDAFETVREDAGFGDSSRVWFVGTSPLEPAPAGYVCFLDQASSQVSGNVVQSHAISKTDTCFYIFTSGTSGMPKASRMSHGRWMRGGAGLGLAGLRLAPRDRLYCPLPLYHNNALTVAWSSVLCAGATLVLARKFSVTDFWPEVRAQRVTVFCYIGELCRYLLQAPAHPADRDHHVRAVIGNGLRPDIWYEFKTRFGINRICEFYGASEGNLVFVNGFNMDRTAGFCPLPYAVVACDPETEMPQRNAKGRMFRVKRGETGLLLNKVTDFAPFEGYADVDAAQDKLFRNVFRKGDCYFNTGDLVRDQGMRHIEFIDRLGDTFRWKGENVATSQVEAVFNAHPQIREAVVYGVTVPNSDGRAGMAAVTPDCAADEIDWVDVTRYLRSTLPDFAVPLFVRLRDRQAVTGTLKYRKVELKHEGYAPNSMAEPVYFLPPGGVAYVQLDAARRRDLDDGAMRL